MFGGIASCGAETSLPPGGRVRHVSVERSRKPQRRKCRARQDDHAGRRMHGSLGQTRSARVRRSRSIALAKNMSGHAGKKKGRQEPADGGRQDDLCLLLLTYYLITSSRNIGSFPMERSRNENQSSRQGAPRKASALHTSTSPAKAQPYRKERTFYALRVELAANRKRAAARRKLTLGGRGDRG